MDQDWLNILLLFGFLQGALLGGFILLSKFFKSKANQYFAGILIVISILGILPVLINFFGEQPFLICLNDIMLEFLFPVFFFFYFASSLQVPIMKDGKRKLLYLPFLIAASINIWIDLDMDFHLFDFGIKEDNPILLTYYFWEYLAATAYTLFLSIWSLLVILKYREATKQRLGTDWLFQFWMVSNFIILLWLVDTITDLTIHLDLVNWIFLALCLLFFWISYRGVYQFKLAEDQFEIRSIRASKAAKTQEKEDPIPDSENAYLYRLQTLMEREHLFRDPTINRDRIAEKLGISSGYFSQIFGTVHEVNFSEYLNQLRVEDVKKMLVDADFSQYSLVAIGLEAGFKSKSNFYAVFKKLTGQTPAEFKKSQDLTPTSQKSKPRSYPV